MNMIDEVENLEDEENEKKIGDGGTL